MEPYIKFKGNVESSEYNPKNNLTFIKLDTGDELYQEGKSYIRRLDKVILTVANSGTKKCIKYVYLTIPDNLNYLNNYFKDYFRNNYGNTVFERFLSNVIRRKDGKDMVTYLNDVAYTYFNQHDIYLLKYRDYPATSTMTGTTPIRFLKSWYENKFTRPLLALGMTREVIEDTMKNEKELMEFILRTANPYLCPFIPRTMCESIEVSMGIVGIPNEDKDKALIMNFIAEKTTKFAWNYCPKKYVLEKFPEYNIIKDDLKLRFSLYEDGDNCYIRDIYDIQSSLVRYLRDIYKEDLEPVSNIFINDKMTVNQKNSIMGVLSSNISLLNGRAGTGKCLDPNTLVKMHNRTLKKVKDLKVNDNLLGPDLVPRKVLSITSGYDKMFIIRYPDGEFKCNSVHVLTVYDKRDKIVKDVPLDKIHDYTNYQLIRKTINFSQDDQEALFHHTGEVTEKIKRLVHSLGLYINGDKPSWNRYNHNIAGSLLDFEIIPCGYGKYCGFELDSDGRFLLSDNVITHNTTCITEIAKHAIRNKLAINVVSFTGKAVSRDKESLHLTLDDEEFEYIEGDIMTIHKMMTKFPDKMIDYLVIDEASMVSTPLLHKLLTMLHGMIRRIIFTGDNNQISPIEWGSIFYQCIRSGVFPTFELTENFRVDDKDNGILKIANSLLDDPKFEFRDYDEFKMYVHENMMDEIESIVNFIGYSDDNNETSIVISCYNATVDNYNVLIQQKIHEKDEYLEERFNFVKKRKWYVGDRVMQIENDNERDIYNGNTGKIVELRKNSIMVQFDSPKKVLEYFIEDWSETELSEDTKMGKPGGKGKPTKNENLTKALKLAYIVTVNKAQGSEWDNGVIVGSDVRETNFVNMNKFYTAVTRFKKILFVFFRDLNKLTRAVRKKQSYRYDETWMKFREVLEVIGDGNEEDIYGDEVYESTESMGLYDVESMLS